MLRKSGRNHAAHAQRRAKSTDPSRQQQKQQQGRPQQRYRGSSRAPSVVPSSIAEENDIDSNERGVTVVLPEAVFFNGMNCIERPHWSVVDNGRAANGEDQTMSLSMWLSPSASLRLKKTDGKRTNAARMKSNLATQALQGKEELTLMPGGGSNSSEGGDWYVVVNRQRTLNTQVDPIDRMLGGGDNGGGNGGSSSSGGGGGGSSSNDDDGDGNINSADENKRLVVVDVLLEPKKKVAQTFDYANRIGARYVVFVAPSEWENGCVRIKDLRAEEYAEDDADKQVDVKIEDLWNALEQMRENENRVRARRGFASL